MGIDGFFHFINVLPQLVLVDLLLSGDNAMVIALACRSLPLEQMRRAILIGTGGAIVLRILMATVVGLLLSIPLLKLVGGIALVVIAIKLLLIEEEGEVGDPQDRGTSQVSPDLVSAVSTIVVADIVMSLDNVVGLAAVAQGDLLLLALGLLISMPLLMFGSLFVTSLLQRYPLVVRGVARCWAGSAATLPSPTRSWWTG